MEGQALHVRLSAMIEGKVCSWTIADYLPLINTTISKKTRWQG